VGTIAYIRDRSEIRTIAADGTGDRLLWKHPNPSVAGGIFGTTGLAWSPDGQELAFASGHETGCSFFESDIYTIRADGSGLRRITNPPSYTAAQALPHGAVVVTVQNDAVRGPTSGLLLVSIAGADKVQTMVVPRGETRTTTFDHVADLGDASQPIIALQGMYRWAIPGINVFAGQTIKAPPLVLMGNGLRNFGAHRPVWRPDGKEIGYTLGSGVGLYAISTSAKPGAGPGHELAGTSKPGAATFDWGPANAPGGPILYTGALVSKDNAVYQASVDGTQRRKVLSTDAEFDYMLDVHWLPDGSGFLYIQNSNTAGSSDVFRHDFATGRSTQLTRVQGKHIQALDVSPDGKWVAYLQTTELWPSLSEPEKPAIWIMRVDGSAQRLLVENGNAPTWKR
jgi:Tol biopolymer transport system component